jgi:DNA replication protein DnaC
MSAAISNATEQILGLTKALDACAGDHQDTLGPHKASIDEVIEELQKVDILVLDDLGGETFSAWSINDVLYKIIDYRNRSGLLTCYSSSYSLEDLQKEYLKRSSKATRLISKIQAYADEVELKGASAL